MKRIVLGMLLAGTAAVAVAQDKPDWVVKDLYVPLTVAEVNPEKLFTKDLAEALKADAAAAKAMTFDYRFDSPGADGGALDFATEQAGEATARVRADFVLKGKARKVLYTVCKAEDGKWRIADVSAPGKWEMRKTLKLASASAC